MFEDLTKPSAPDEDEQSEVIEEDDDDESFTYMGREKMSQKGGNIWKKMLNEEW
jgi:hypothetical protein